MWSALLSREMALAAERRDLERFDEREKRNAFEAKHPHSNLVESIREKYRSDVPSRPGRGCEIRP